MSDAAALRWEDLDPRTHPFELGGLDVELRSLVTAARAEGEHEQMIYASIGQLVEERFGAWAIGWTWSRGNGGPVEPSVATPASVLAADLGTERTCELVIAALVQWRAYLEALAAVFHAVHAEVGTGDAALAVETAVPRIVDLVVERTRHADAWYVTLVSAVRWFAETVMCDPRQARVVDQALNGRFASGTAPTRAQRAVFEELTAQIERVEAYVLDDALGSYWSRRSIFDDMAEIPVGARPALEVDAHARFIDEHDRARDAVRADRMASALLLCRDSARRGLALSFDQLAEWQAVVLGAGQPEGFRTTDAYGKRGRERYRIAPETPRVFERALVEASDPRGPVVVRAARVYLDVCFFHPFCDGNARAARLALDHVLTSAGLALRLADPVFLVARSAADVQGHASFARTLDRLVVRRLYTR